MSGCLRLLAFASDNAQNRPVSNVCPQTVCIRAVRASARHELGRVDVRRVRRPRAAGGGLHLVERDAEVADLTVAEYSRISLARGCTPRSDHDLRVRLVGGTSSPAGWPASGEDWLLLVDGRRSGSCVTRASSAIAGSQPRRQRGDLVGGRPAHAARSAAPAVRRPRACLVHFFDDQQVEGRIGRVGRDFFELHVGEGAGRTPPGRAGRGGGSPAGRRDRVSPASVLPSTNGCSSTNCSASA